MHYADQMYRVFESGHLNIMEREARERRERETFFLALLCGRCVDAQLARLTINTYQALGSLSLTLVVRSVVDCSRVSRSGMSGILH